MSEQEHVGHDAATVQRWMTLDLWMAFGGDPADFDDYYDAVGFGDAWASLCAEARRKRTYPLAPPSDRSA